MGRAQFLRWLQQDSEDELFNEKDQKMNMTVTYALTTIETQEDDDEDDLKQCVENFYDDIRISGTTWGEIR